MQVDKLKEEVSNLIKSLKDIATFATKLLNKETMQEIEVDTFKKLVQRINTDDQKSENESEVQSEKSVKGNEENNLPSNEKRKKLVEQNKAEK